MEHLTGQIVCDSVTKQSYQIVDSTGLGETKDKYALQTYTSGGRLCRRKVIWRKREEFEVRED